MEEIVDTRVFFLGIGLGMNLSFLVMDSDNVENMMVQMKLNEQISYQMPLNLNL